jgi:hypothetical protein
LFIDADHKDPEFEKKIGFGIMGVTYTSSQAESKL